MAYQSFEEQIKDYDKRKDIHYHVYFSSASYTYRVDVLQFKKKSDIKNDFYKNKKYYSTYAEAQAVADKLNEKDTDIGHLFGRAASEFEHKMYELLKMGGMTDAQKHAIEAAGANVQALTKLMNNDHF
jgi:hypothetical protein